MKILGDRDDTRRVDRRSAITIGTFDGFHIGHQALVHKVLAAAGSHDAGAVAITFDRHPARVLRPENAPPLLTTFEQRMELLEASGLDAVYVVSFDDERAHTSDEDFVRDVIVDRLQTAVAVVGHDFHFGYQRHGDPTRLTEFGAQHGFAVEEVGWIYLDADDQEPVSSTAVRRALAGGEVELAAAMLGRPHEIRGEVIEGERRGRTIGFPTANIPADPAMAWPADAVYAGWFVRENGARHACAINVGRRPTFHEHAEQSLLEAHLLDFDDDLYGEHVRVELLSLLRSEKRFAGVDELVVQLKRDVERTRDALGVGS